jgi:aerobic-type carbon monoxide dehydrogenase small subunit (CoxS/CutS family)
MSSVSELSVNGRKHRIETDPARSLLNVLRDDLDLTGAKYGCGEGQCGACTVMIEGKARKACVTRVGDCEGKQITTIEGLDQAGKLHPLQEAFLHVGAMQCGYCTPGMIMAGVALLHNNGAPNDRDIRQAMEGNICRCGTYTRILQAIGQAATALKGGAQ